MLGPSIKEKFRKGISPFNFRFIETLKNNLENSDELGPSVVLASPGMLQNGLSRDLFDKWCHDDRNGLIITGFCVEGTMAR
jgi:cleavage and polyadenylation specificity factor subunit 3